MLHVVQQFTLELRRVLVQAAQLAAFQKKNKIEPLHLFYSLTNQTEGFLTDLSLHKKQKKNSKNLSSHHQKAENSSLALSSTSRKIILDAAHIAEKHNHYHIGTEHLFMSLLESGNRGVSDLLTEAHINEGEIKQELGSVLKSSTKLNEILETLFPQGDGEHVHEKNDEGSQSSPQRERNKKQQALDYFATLLTDPERAKKLDPVIGREKEIKRLIQIISRRTKNNPILLGPAGVGKTAIVEGLAKKIVAGDVPEILKTKKIYSLNLTALIAGSAFRGELEMRFKHLLDELSRDPDSIIFIDEIHNLVGSGSSNGSLDGGNILKPALARGELRCIGATTFQEYKKYIEEDPALERRFQPIMINQPSCEESVAILSGLTPHYEDYHHVHISKESIHAAVTLSDRYISEKFLPDKALDILDEAAAKVKIESFTVSPPPVQQREVELVRQKVERFLAHTQGDEPSLILEENDFQNLLSELKTHRLETNPQWYGTVQPTDIADIVSLHTGIPVSRLAEGEKERLLNLEKILSEKIIGQPNVKTEVAARIRKAKSGLAKKNRPLASFLFLGPSGVGKTELAKTLSQELCGPDGLIKFDMSEFSESFTISRLIGAPSGYIGYKEGGRLTESVRQHPFSLVLFDEIEKAHSKIAHLLLQILEDGVLTDSAGKKVDFSNTIIVLTSNLGAQKIHEKESFGFKENTDKNRAHDRKDAFLSELKESFHPELIQRIDHIAIFDPLTRSDLEKIIALHLAELTHTLREQHVTFTLTKRALKKLIDNVCEKGTGGRDVRHSIEYHIESLLADFLLKKNESENSCSIDWNEKGFIITTVNS